MTKIAFALFYAVTSLLTLAFKLYYMAVNKQKYREIIAELEGKATLVAVSKTKPVEDILELYQLGQRDFGENYVQELVDKEAVLPKDIRWHFIGHLQSNKVKYIAPFVHLIHGVDSENLLKFGFSEEEIQNLKIAQFENVKITGLMGMASFSDDMNLVRSEFKKLNSIFNDYFSPKQKTPETADTPLTIHHLPAGRQGSPFTTNHSPFTLSMGMSGDYKIALEEGSNMVRIGSLLFGERNYNK